MLVYAYVGFPAVLAARALVTRQERLTLGGEVPAISILLPVYNGSAVLGARIHQLLSLDYPEDRLELLVISDGSTDGTNEILQSLRDPRLVPVILPERKGKEVALNAGIDRAHHDLLVFIDLGVEVAPEALRRLMAVFADERVGVATGVDESMPTSDSTVVQTAGLYTRYEIAVRRLESRLGSLFVVNGCFFAARRHLCLGMEPWVTVDMWVPVQAIRQGYLVVLEEGAIARVPTTRDVGGEFQRRVRTFHRGMTTYLAAFDLANPVRHGWIAIEYLSHKLARWLVPLWLVGLVASSIALASESPLATAALLGQIGCYGLAVAALVEVVPATLRRVADVCGFYVLANAALVVAWWRVLRGQRVTHWQPTSR
jgi:glycosyltransferase involved in cell wall biosynthesis